jgi:hypothetical protein
LWEERYKSVIVEDVGDAGIGRQRNGIAGPQAIEDIANALWNAPMLSTRPCRRKVLRSSGDDSLLFGLPSQEPAAIFEALEAGCLIGSTRHRMKKHNEDHASKGATQAGQGKRSTSSVVASLMDDFIRIPGTNIRIGLDPILGLFPVLGDMVASLVGVAIMGEAGRRGVSRMVLVTMALNILANAAVGSIPIVGDLFSVWFKSNRRNHDLLQKALSTEIPPAEREKSVRTASRFAILLIAGVIVGVVLIVIGIVALLKVL